MRPARPLSHSRAGVRHEAMNTIHSIVYTVSDLAAAKAIHTALLGADPHTDTPYYVGYNVGGELIATATDPDGTTLGLIQSS